ncbi:hypothetical protein ACFQ1E_07090 [Sphingomonas canadensis]|uniref:Uncharacterized protein n=1 Tax=Sphingomonas canadensis TaxID=1219257 RepID=A0ABW3H6U4_9SPHN|nr:hypothetical protein [Sphingomonas canadensis]MCW3835449.1 hypothetical protein [Sphingomonas canadensis]
MSNEIDKAECPFSGHGEELVNVKFFRGRRDDIITVDEIHEQFRSAKMQHRQRTATISKQAPVSDHPVMDMREFVAAL